MAFDLIFNEGALSTEVIDDDCFRPARILYQVAIMVLPAQFQLGLELTNVLNPIGQTVSALSSLALVDAIKKSGSDVITEMRLASLIGRHRIDPIIEFHFREAVAKADQSFISRYMDIILESGAGPTVQEALKNPALFSMVI